MYSFMGQIRVLFALRPPIHDNLPNYATFFHYYILLFTPKYLQLVNRVRTRLAIPQRNFLEKNFITFVSASSDAAICRYIDCYSLVEDNLSFLGIYMVMWGVCVCLHLQI